MKQQCLAIDIGGTYIKYGLVDATGQIQDKGKVKTPESLDELRASLKEIIHETRLTIDGIGISCPGKVDTHTGTIFYGGSLDYLHDVALKSEIEDYVQLPCQIINDGKAAAFAEYWLGNLTEVQNGAAVVLGTGVGGGILVNGTVLDGSHFQAGELSLMVNINEMTGETSLVGAAASAVGFIRRCNRQLHHADLDDGVSVFDALAQRNTIILPLFETYCRNIAVLIMNLQAVIDIEKVVIGGGISQQPLLIEEIQRQYLTLRTTYPIVQRTITEIPIENCRFLNDANLLGAVADFFL